MTTMMQAARVSTVCCVATVTLAGIFGCGGGCGEGPPPAAILLSVDAKGGGVEEVARIPVPEHGLGGITATFVQNGDATVFVVQHRIDNERLICGLDCTREEDALYLLDAGAADDDGDGLPDARELATGLDLAPRGFPSVAADDDGGFAVAGDIVRSVSSHGDVDTLEAAEAGTVVGAAADSVLVALDTEGAARFVGADHAWDRVLEALRPSEGGQQGFIGHDGGALFFFDADGTVRAENDDVDGVGTLRMMVVDREVFEPTSDGGVVWLGTDDADGQWRINHYAADATQVSRVPCPALDGLTLDGRHLFAADGEGSFRELLSGALVDDHTLALAIGPRTANSTPVDGSLPVILFVDVDDGHEIKRVALDTPFENRISSGMHVERGTAGEALVLLAGEP